MEHRADAIEVALPRRHSLRIRDGEGLIVEVVEGCLWLTQDQDSKDYIAKAGQSLAIEHGGLTLAFACSAARLRLRRPGAACAPAMEFGGRNAHGAGNTHPLPFVPVAGLCGGLVKYIRALIGRGPAQPLHAGA